MVLASRGALPPASALRWRGRGLALVDADAGADMGVSASTDYTSLHHWLGAEGSIISGGVREGVLVVTIAPGRGSPAEHGAAGLDRRGSPAEHGGHARHWQSQSGIMSGIRGISGVRPAAYIVQ